VSESGSGFAEGVIEGRARFPHLLSNHGRAQQSCFRCVSRPGGPTCAASRTSGWQLNQPAARTGARGAAVVEAAAGAAGAAGAVGGAWDAAPTGARISAIVEAARAATVRLALPAAPTGARIAAIVEAVRAAIAAAPVTRLPESGLPESGPEPRATPSPHAETTRGLELSAIDAPNARSGVWKNRSRHVPARLQARWDDGPSAEERRLARPSRAGSSIPGPSWYGAVSCQPT
jgi:hypothetical protein